MTQRTVGGAYKPSHNAQVNKKKGLLQEIETAIDRLADAVNFQRHSEEFQRWLQVLSNFHSYSLNNTLLILSRMPDATMVAGYRSWQKLGRQVKRGEKGIPIFAPIVYRRPRKTQPATSLDGVGDDEGLEEVAVGFRVVHVFDISQTEGEPLPTLDHTLHGDDSDLLELAVRTATRLGYNVTVETLPEGVNGVAKPPRDITVNRGLPAQGQAKTIFHELAHHLLGHTSPGGHEESRQIREITSEATAYTVLAYLGVDSTAPSARYLASWQADKDNLKKALEAIRQTASRLISSIEEVRAL